MQKDVVATDLSYHLKESIKDEFAELFTQMFNRSMTQQSIESIETTLKKI